MMLGLPTLVELEKASLTSLCLSPAGGPIRVTFPPGLSLDDIVRKNPYVSKGGRYRPPDCDSTHKTAIIIPHRNREQHLKYLLYYLHPFLQRQQLNYGIYIIHQVWRSTV